MAKTKIHLTTEQIDELAAKLEDGDKAIAPAMRRAVNKVSRWVNEEAWKRIAGASGVESKIIGGRIKLSAARESGDSIIGQVWVGLDPISLRRLGATQDGSGVTAGPGKAPGAFIVGKLNDHVFKRRNNKDVNPKKHGLPIDKQEYTIAQKSELILATLADLAGKMLLEEFARELKWQTN